MGSVASLLVEKLRARDQPGLEDYKGPVGLYHPNGAAAKHMWRRQLPDVECELYATIDINVCWDPNPTQMIPRSRSALGVVGMNPRHSGNCAQLTKEEFQ